MREAVAKQLRSSCGGYENSRTGAGGKKGGHRRVGRSGTVVQEKIFKRE